MDKPAKPTLAAVPGSSTSLTATWTEPGLNGGPDTFIYTLRYREGTTGEWADTAIFTDRTSATITGLTADTEYLVQVSANNGELASDWSDPSDAVRTNADDTPPPAPTVESLEVTSWPQQVGDVHVFGETIVFTLTFGEKVRVKGQPQPTLAFDLGGSEREARYHGLSDTDYVQGGPQLRPRPQAVKLHFAYTVKPGDRDADGVEVGELSSAIRLSGLGGARIRSAATGVDADLSHAAVGPLSGHKVDGGTAQPPAGGGSHVTLGGQRLSFDGNAPDVPDGTGPEAADGLTPFADRIAAHADGGAWQRRKPGAARSLTGRELLLGSSFRLALGGGDANRAGTSWTAWGRAAQSRFDGDADGLALDGDVTTFTLGADATWSRWLAGVALAHSTGDTGCDGAER